MVQVNGTLTGRVLTGTWKQVRWRERRAAFVVTFAVDGMSFAGTWGYGTQSVTSYNSWIGTRGRQG